MRLVAALTRRIPRSHFLIDVLIDFVRRDPPLRSPCSMA